MLLKIKTDSFIRVDNQSQNSKKPAHNHERVFVYVAQTYLKGKLALLRTLIIRDHYRSAWYSRTGNAAHRQNVFVGL